MLATLLCLASLASAAELKRTDADNAVAADYTAKASEQAAWKAGQPRYKQEPLATLAPGFTREVHEYDGPFGKGFVIIYTHTEAGKTFVKRLHHGPETYRAHDWK